MNLWGPRKRLILGIHRWLGVFSAVFLVILAVTGLALNHSVPLGLDEIKMRNPWILHRYGMSAPAEIEAFRIHDSDTIAHLDGRLFYNEELLVEAGRPVGLYEGDVFSVVAGPEQLIILSPDGELVEEIGSAQMPFDQIQYLGESGEGDPVIVTAGGPWRPDDEWLEFSPHGGAFSVEPLEPVTLTDEQARRLLETYQGEGLSLYRVLLDLHSGRLFGWAGRTVMDLTAIAILLLISTGLSGWLRKSMWTNQQKR